MGDDLNWQWDSGHLVIVGDLFDKGPGVTECLWLIKKLEEQAEEADGKIHFLLGDHEILVLKGGTDIRYRGLKYRIISTRIDVVYGTLFGKDTELGRWMRTKNTVVKINDKLFVHGGISERIVDRNLTIEDLNTYVRKLTHLDHWLSVDPEERKLYKLIDSNRGPYWYGGYVGFMGYVGGDDISLQTMDKILSFYGCSQVIVGHQIVEGIKFLHDNKVVAINVKLPTDDIIEEDSNAQMLLIEGDEMFRLRINGNKEKLD